jgi:predicted phosphate transport protein (TIGR00153 family)
MLARSAVNVAAGAEALLDLVEHYEDVERKVRRLKDIEHDGDEATHAIFDALNRSLVTPFDRDDIARLASALDDVLDWTEEAARRLLAYRLPEPTELSRRFARVIVDQSRTIQRAVPLLQSLRDVQELQRLIVELHRLENEGDDLMTEALGTLYDRATDVPSLVSAVKWGDIYVVLEEATDRGEHVGIALESIVVKHA